MAQDNKVEGIESGDSSSKRGKAWEMARQQMQMNNLKREQNNPTTQDETGNKKYSLVDKSVTTEQTLNPESFDEEGGSISGSYHAGSTITSNQNTNTDTDGGSSGGGKNPSKGDSIKVESEKLPKGKLKNISVSLFDEE